MMDVLIIPSEWYENNPLVILEAFQYGLTVIGSDIGGIPEIIVDGKNGLLFQCGNKKLLAEKMDLLCNDLSYLELLKKEAFAYAKKFTIDNMIDKYEKKFFKLLNFR